MKIQSCGIFLLALPVEVKSNRIKHSLVHDKDTLKTFELA